MGGSRGAGFESRWVELSTHRAEFTGAPALPAGSGLVESASQCFLHQKAFFDSVTTFDGGFLMEDF